MEDYVEDVQFTAYRWQVGIEFAAEPRTEDAETAKREFTRLADLFAERGDLPDEFRVTDAHYAFEALPVSGGLHINHFEVYTRREGIGSHLIDELERVARECGLEEVTIWIGANEDGETESFLDAHGYEYGPADSDPAYGRTLEAAKEL